MGGDEEAGFLFLVRCDPDGGGGARLVRVWGPRSRQDHQGRDRRVQQGPHAAVLAGPVLHDQYAQGERGEGRPPGGGLEHIDQQVSTMIQNNQPPDVLNLNTSRATRKDGLLYSGTRCCPRRRARTFSRLCTGGGVPGHPLWLSDPGQRPGLLLQHGPVRSAPVSRRRPGPGTSCAGRGENPGPRRWHDRLRVAARARGGAGRVVDRCGTMAATGSRAILDDHSERNVAGPAVSRRPGQSTALTQVNPGRTNRTDGAFQLFKDGKVAW